MNIRREIIRVHRLASAAQRDWRCNPAWAADRARHRGYDREWRRHRRRQRAPKGKHGRRLTARERRRNWGYI